MSASGTYLTETKYKLNKSTSKSKKNKFQQLVDSYQDVPLLYQLESLHRKNVEKMHKKEKQAKESENYFEKSHKRYDKKEKLQKQTLKKYTEEHKRDLRLIEKKHEENQRRAMQNHRKIQRVMADTNQKRKNEQDTKTLQATNNRLEKTENLRNSRERYKERPNLAKELKENEERQSYVLFVETIDKLKQAEMRKKEHEKHRSDQVFGKKDERITQAQQSSQLQLQNRISQLIQKSVKKNSRSKLNKSQEIGNSTVSNPRITDKKLKEAMERKKYLDVSFGSTSSKKAKQREEKMMHTNHRRQELLDQLSHKIGENRKKRCKSVEKKNNALHEKIDSRSNELVTKEQEDWSYIQGFKEQRERLIKNNLYDLQQIRLRS